MKKLLFIFLALCCSLLAMPQGTQHLKYYNPALQLWKWDTITTFTNGNARKRIIQTYNSSGNVATRLTQALANYYWLNLSSSVYTYDTVNLVTTELIRAWQGGTWVDSERNTLTETISGTSLVFTKVTDTWQGRGWAQTLRNTHTIGAGSSLTFSDLNEKWVNNAWVNVSNTISWIDILHLQYGQTSQVWNDNDWVNSWNDIYTVDFTLTVQSVLHQVWAGGAWFNQSLFNYSNNDGGYPGTILRQEWRSGAWSDSAKTQWTYDVNNNSTSGTYLAWKSGAWQPSAGTMKVYYSGSVYTYFEKDEVDSSFVYRASYAYVPSGIGEVPDSGTSISLYPDPAGETVTLDWKDFSPGEHADVIFIDFRGKLVKELKLNAAKTLISLDRLTPGEYLLKLNSGEKTITARLLKK